VSEPKEQLEQLRHAPGDEAARRAAEEILDIHLKTHGVGAKEARADFFGEASLVVFLDGLELLPNEEFLISQDESEAVMNARSRYQEAVAERFIAAVERATGRRVETFSSITNLEGKRFAAEIFTFHPADDPEGPPLG
jgi:uncharacterized protein YbcI